MDSTTIPIESTVRPVAEALAYRWGKHQKRPPDFIDDLMIDLTTELLLLQKAGDEKRAECLDAVLDVLAEGIIKFEHSAGQDLEEEALDRAINRLRTCYYLESGGRGAGNPGARKREGTS